MNIQHNPDNQRESVSPKTKVKQRKVQIKTVTNDNQRLSQAKIPSLKRKAKAHRGGSKPGLPIKIMNKAKSKVNQKVQEIEQSPKRDQILPSKPEILNQSATKILQKWFLANIERPYLDKKAKIQLANETGLDKKQIQDWFTNNRKRKYQQIVKMASQKNKDFNYIREVMKLKFQKNMELTSSDGETNSVNSIQKNEIGIKRGSTCQIENKYLKRQKIKSEQSEPIMSLVEENDEPEEILHQTNVRYQNQVQNRSMPKNESSNKTLSSRGLKQFVHKNHEKIEGTNIIPILLVWCPKLINNEPCNCGSKSFVPVPSIKTQIRQHMKYQYQQHKAETRQPKEQTDMKAFVRDVQRQLQRLKEQIKKAAQKSKSGYKCRTLYKQCIEIEEKLQKTQALSEQLINQGNSGQRYILQINLLSRLLLNINEISLSYNKIRQESLKQTDDVANFRQPANINTSSMMNSTAVNFKNQEPHHKPKCLDSNSPVDSGGIMVSNLLRSQNNVIEGAHGQLLKSNQQSFRFPMGSVNRRNQLQLSSYERGNTQINDNIQYLQDTNLLSSQNREQLIERNQSTGIDLSNLANANRVNQAQSMAASKVFESKLQKEGSGEGSEDRKQGCIGDSSADLRGMGSNEIMLNPSNNPVSRSGTGNSGPANTSGGIVSFASGSSPPGSAAEEQNHQADLEKGVVRGKPLQNDTDRKIKSGPDAQEIEGRKVQYELNELFLRQLIQLQQQHKQQTAAMKSTHAASSLLDQSVKFLRSSVSAQGIGTASETENKITISQPQTTSEKPSVTNFAKYNMSLADLIQKLGQQNESAKNNHHQNR